MYAIRSYYDILPIDDTVGVGPVLEQPGREQDRVEEGAVRPEHVEDRALDQVDQAVQIGVVLPQRVGQRPVV